MSFDFDDYGITESSLQIDDSFLDAHRVKKPEPQSEQAVEQPVLAPEPAVPLVDSPTVVPPEVPSQATPSHEEAGERESEAALQPPELSTVAERLPDDRQDRAAGEPQIGHERSHTGSGSQSGPGAPSEAAQTSDAVHEAEPDAGGTSEHSPDDEPVRLSQEHLGHSDVRGSSSTPSMSGTTTADRAQTESADEPPAELGPPRSPTRSQSPTELPAVKGFSLHGTAEVPHVRKLPEPVLDALRAQLRETAVRDFNVSLDGAQAFVMKLSQNSIALAFFMARLGVELAVDEATEAAMRLFQSHDPMMGLLIERLDRLEETLLTQQKYMDRTAQTVKNVEATAQVIEQGVAYSIADRTENFLQAHNYALHKSPFQHPQAVWVRDELRREQRDLHTREQRENGRPIR